MAIGFGAKKNSTGEVGFIVPGHASASVGSTAYYGGVEWVGVQHDVEGN